MSKVKHPFEPFVPLKIKYLVLGTFPGKEMTASNQEHWYYGAPRNQFWKIIYGVYKKEVKTKKQKIELFTSLGIGFTDIYSEIKRERNSNLDDKIIREKGNSSILVKLVEEGRLKNIFFTSRKVEREFKKEYQTLNIGVYIPSPSPRNARISVSEKIRVYKSILPELKGGD